MNVGGWTPDSLIRTEQHFKTSGLAKPLMPTGHAAGSLGRLELRGRLPEDGTHLEDGFGGGPVPISRPLLLLEVCTHPLRRDGA